MKENGQLRLTRDAFLSREHQGSSCINAKMEFKDVNPIFTWNYYYIKER